MSIYVLQATLSTNMNVLPYLALQGYYATHRHALVTNFVSVENVATEFGQQVYALEEAALTD